MNDYNFGPASEDDSIVHGAAGPADEVKQWISFMRSQGIERVCCLETERPELIAIYETEFGKDNVKSAPIPDFHLCSISDLTEEILPFLQDSYVKNKRVVVHCTGGNGRTGHVLAAWLVFHSGLLPTKAIEAVEQMGRDPKEAIGRSENATEKGLLRLLTGCKDL